MSNNYLTIELTSKRKSLVQFLDRGVELVLLTALVVVPLGFPRFLVLFPLDEWPFSILWPKDWLTNHTPLNLKESLATFLAILGLMLWMMRTVASGKIRFVWTPLHWPFTGLLLLAGVSLLRPVSILPQMRDYCLVICYSSLIHLYLLYGYRDRKFRRKSLRLFLWVGAVFTAIVFAMDQGWTLDLLKNRFRTIVRLCMRQLGIIFQWHPTSCC